MQPNKVNHPLATGPATSYVIKEPLGVISILGSWNCPMITVINPLVAVIAAGNCAIIKPSELSPWSSNLVKSLIQRYLDTSCYQVVMGAVKVAIRATSIRVDKIIYTGSTEKGMLVAQAAAKNLVPCILELGGKSPCIVDKSCNLDYTALKVAMAAFLNFG